MARFLSEFEQRVSIEFAVILTLQKLNLVSSSTLTYWSLLNKNLKIKLKLTSLLITRFHLNWIFTHQHYKYNLVIIISLNSVFISFVASNFIRKDHSHLIIINLDWLLEYFINLLCLFGYLIEDHYWLINFTDLWELIIFRLELVGNKTSFVNLVSVNLKLFKTYIFISLINNKKIYL